MRSYTVPLRISSGAGEATGAGSDTLAIPNASGGNPAEVVAISVTTATYILPVKNSGDTVTSSTGMVLDPAQCPLILNVKGAGFIAHLRVASSGVITLNPVENFG